MTAQITVKSVQGKVRYSLLTAPLLLHLQMMDLIGLLL